MCTLKRQFQSPFTNLFHHFIDGRKKHRKTSQKKPWTTVEKKAVHEYFSEHFRDNRLAKKNECDKFIELNKNILQDREWGNVRDYVRNFNTAKKKRTK